MAIQSIPRSGGPAGVGGALGQGLGDSLSAGLQSLVQAKVDQITKRQAMKELQSAFPDLPQGTLAFLSSKPPKEQMEYLQGLGEQQRLQNEQGQQQEQQFSLDSVTPEQREQLKSYLASPEAQRHAPEEIEKLQRFLSSPIKPQAQQPEQGLKLSQLGAGKNKSLVEINMAQQPKIQKLNATFTDQLKAEAPVAKQIVEKAKQLLAMEEAGETPENAFTRAGATYLPGFLNVYNEYNAKANEIAALKSAKTGRPSVFMTQLQQSTKPNTSQSKQERINLLNDLIENSEPIVKLEQATDEIIAENEGLQPLNLKKLATERAIQNELSSIDASDYKDNTVIELFGKQFIKKDGEFVPVKKGK